jgi:Capsule polysaccharide biosynthesis protein
MRFLFTTIQFIEADFYRRVSEHLRDLGHEVAHVVISRQSAAEMRAAGHEVRCLPDLIESVNGADLGGEVARLEAAYDLPSLRDVYVSDPACAGRDERWCIERTVRHFVALERAFEELRPGVLVPEIGSETMRTAANLIAWSRGVTTISLFYTIFPNPLRMYVDTLQGPIVPEEEVRPLSDAERREVEDFIAAYRRRGTPTLPHRQTAATPGKVRDFAGHVVRRTVHERDNEYLRPTAFVKNYAQQKTRAVTAKRYYEPIGERPFVYFPLHVTDDFKVKRVIPHCVDQEYLIKQVAGALPQGYDILLKEHPVSIGRNPAGMLRRLSRIENARLVEPYTSSHELIQKSDAVVVISSTVGLEALLYGKPVLTMGLPFYSGYGATVDIDSFREIRNAVPELLHFAPDRERVLQFLHAAMRSTYAGAPVGVDSSDTNAETLARSLDLAGRKHAGGALSVRGY